MPSEEPGLRQHHFPHASQASRTGGQPSTRTDLKGKSRRTKLLAAAFAAAVDATTRLHEGGIGTRAAELPGMRGGTINIDQRTRAFSPVEVRYVVDVRFSGLTTVNAGYRAHTVLDVSGVRAELCWPILDARQNVEVTGSLAAKAFHTWLPSS